MVSALTSLKANFGNMSAQIGRSSAKSAGDVARLSSGNRLTRAADDVASLSISTRLSGRVTALRTGLTNMSQATSYLQVQDGALKEMDGMIQRMNALSVHASSGALSSAERGFLNQEFQALRAEVSRTIEVTNFNGVNVFADHFTANAAATRFSIPQEEIILPAGAIVHYDPSDPTSVIDGSGLSADQAGFNPSDVRQLLDVSGNGHTLTQNTANQRPDYVTDINGGTSDAIFFDGINDRMTGTIPTTTSELTTFTIFNRTSAGAREFVFEYGSGGENSRDIFGTNGTQFQYYIQPATGPASPANLSNSLVVGEYTLAETYSSDTSIEFYQNGTLNNTVAITNGRAPSTSFTLGDDSTSGDWLQGNMAEHISYERALTLDERQRVEGYLAQKHGITLPPGHPYAFAGDELVSATSYDIPRYLRPGDTIGTLESAIPNVSATFQFVNHFNPAFSVHPRTGDITINDITALDKDVAEYSLTIRATLSNGQTTDVTMQVDIGYQGLLFQTDREASEAFEIAFDELTTEDIFGLQPMDLLTKENAQAAQERLRDAMDVITARRADVGAKQSAAGFVSDAISERLRSQDYARGVMADTDVAATSTDYAQQTAKNQMSITMAAQANSLRENTITDILENGIQITT